jgi:epsin
VSAKELTSLILDEERLRSERSDRRNWKSRVTGIEEFARPQEEPRRSRPHRAQRADEEDAEYQLAIEASKAQEEEDRRKRESRGATRDPEDDDLAKALKLSREEEELRKRELEDQNAASLFDDDLIQVAQPTGNQGYQQQPAVDWSGNPVDPNMTQQQPTGYVNPYGNGFQPQQTGFPANYSNGVAAQPTSFDPYGQQQQQQQQFQPQQQFQQPQQFQQQQTLQPGGVNPYASQTPSTYPPPQQPGTNNPWANNNQQSLQPTPTGSNNPFASSFQQRSSSTPAKPTLATLQEQKTLQNFTNNPVYHSPSSFTPPPLDPNSHEARLNALLAGGGDGLDTFGNTGNLRIPAQHTAPGTFVNSAGAGLGRIHDQRTGNNPFLPNQFTGMPQTTYNQMASHQVPAATGPAGMASGFGGAFGGQPSNNPFGQKPQQGQGGQDLIQF